MKLKPDSEIGHPEVSIVVPNYNHASFLEKRLDTIFNQTFQDFEVILLDDGSTDNSLEILRGYCNHPKVSHCFFEKQNSGLPFKQWQKGIQKAKGEYVWIAESDDWAELNFLEKLVPQLDEKTGIVFCKSYTYLESKKKLSSYYFPEDLYPERWNKSTLFDGHDLLENYHVHINTIPNASACVFKKDLAQFDDDLLGMKFCGDWLFWAQIITDTNVYFLSERLNYWRISALTVRAKKNPEVEKKRYNEFLFCLEKNISLSNRGKVDLTKYKWLFHHYFSLIPIWKIPTLKKPDIPVSTFSFKFYLFRSTIYFFLKRTLSSFKKI